jgi:hypothetical protein
MKLIECNEEETKQMRVCGYAHVLCQHQRHEQRMPTGAQCNLKLSDAGYITVARSSTRIERVARTCRHDQSLAAHIAHIYEISSYSH